MQISRCTKSDYDQIVSPVEEFWGSDRTLSLHHPIFIHEFGNTAFAIKNGLGLPPIYGGSSPRYSPQLTFICLP